MLTKLGLSQHLHVSYLKRTLKVMAPLGLVTKQQRVRRLRAKLSRRLITRLRLPYFLSYCNFLFGADLRDRVVRLGSVNRKGSGTVNSAFSELQTPTYRDLVSNLTLSTQKTSLSARLTSSTQTHRMYKIDCPRATISPSVKNPQKLTSSLTTVLYLWPCLPLLKYLFFTDISRQGPQNWSTGGADQLNLFYKVQM